MIQRKRNGKEKRGFLRIFARGPPLAADGNFPAAHEAREEAHDERDDREGEATLRSGVVVHSICCLGERK